MTRISNLALVLTLNCLCSAGGLCADEEAPKDLESSIQRALAATDLSAQNAGLRITARVKFLNLKAGDLEGTYSKFWGPDRREREEIKVDAFREIEVALADKRWNFKNIKHPPLPILLLEDMTSALASLHPPLAAPSEYRLHDREIRGQKAQCFEGGTEERLGSPSSALSAIAAPLCAM